jgi:uncharacterized membrane protein YeiH
MTDSAFQVPILFDYAATFTWAVSGAVVAIRRRLDITGVFVLALLAALGGGLLRDTLFLNRAPVALINPMYLTLVFCATIVTSVSARYLRKFIGPTTVGKIVDYIDALGTPAFAGLCFAILARWLPTTTSTWMLLAGATTIVSATPRASGRIRSRCLIQRQSLF